MNEYELENAPAQEWEGEWEGQVEGEWEDEWEGEWEGEWENEWEDELEGEWEDELEADTEEFFGRIAALARRAASSPSLQRIGRAAADAALRGLTDGAGQVSSSPDRPNGRSNGRSNGQPGGRRSASAGRPRSAAPPQSEYEEEWEDEYEANPIRRVYPEALLEHMGHAAATAQSEAEAEAYIGAIVPLASHIRPAAAAAMTRATPSLVRGLAAVARSLRSNPNTKPLVRTLPEVMRRTAASIAHQSAQGRPVTPQAAVRTLAQQTAKVVSDPREATQAYRKSRAADQQHHRKQRAG